MKRKLLYVAIGAAISLPSFAASDIKSQAPNQYDCTIDELELHIMKRTENLRKESTVATWEDFKKTAQAQKMSGGTGSSASNTPANGSSAAEASTAMKKTGSTSAKEEDDCPLFFEGLTDIDTSGMSIDDLGGLFTGGLSSLQDLANEQMAKLSESLTNVLKEGLCSRLSSEAVMDFGTDLLDDALKDEIGYTTKDISGGNFANEVVNDSLKEEKGSSNAKLWNVMDEDLNDNREKYMEKQLDNKLDDVGDSIEDSVLD